MNRKQFLINSAKGVVLTTILPSTTLCRSNGQQGTAAVNNDFNPDLDIELTALPSEIQLFSGSKTNVYTYRSRVISRKNSSVENIGGSYLGPIIRTKQGQKIRVRFKNNLSRESVIHWHGLHIPPEMDGHPMYAIENGEQYVYEFAVNNRPGTYWFHPHPDKITGPQVYRGQAGLFIVEDHNNELPSGEFDIPLIIQDRMFDEKNQLVYLQQHPMAQMQGFLGNYLFINGNPDTTYHVSKSTYRFRVLNGSNSRIYKLAWDDGEDLTVIGTDGGLLEKPVKKPYLMLAPGERAEIWKDFLQAGDEIRLQSLAFNDGSSMGMGRGMMQDMMRMPHPVHLHGLQFRILERDISGMSHEVWRSVKDGFIDDGWQDTFLLMPGMRVKIIMRFRDFTGLYVYHCHNLEHEDMGMMRNYEVVG